MPFVYIYIERVHIHSVFLVLPINFSFVDPDHGPPRILLRIFYNGTRLVHVTNISVGTDEFDQIIWYTGLKVTLFEYEGG